VPLRKKNSIEKRVHIHINSDIEREEGDEREKERKKVAPLASRGISVEKDFLFLFAI
jgi:hypothetical protein